MQYPHPYTFYNEGNLCHAARIHAAAPTTRLEHTGARTLTASACCLMQLWPDATALKHCLA